MMVVVMMMMMMMKVMVLGFGEQNAICFNMANF